MVTKEIVELARANMKTNGRYDYQELLRVGGKFENIRKDWTPAQLRRMRKKFNRRTRMMEIRQTKGAYFMDELADFVAAMEANGEGSGNGQS